MGFVVTRHPIVDVTEDRWVLFTFDDTPMRARAGRPIASALMENGVNIFRQTEKSGEPRGVFCGIGQCNDCVVVVNRVPNVRSCVTMLEEGMEICTQMGFGRVE